uniref:Uncharacterized protein n=1 Tax=Caenorhabditis japonica TaxID=281687 RepID=A0A8R1I9I4_CAEJA
MAELSALWRRRLALVEWSVHAYIHCEYISTYLFNVFQINTPEEFHGKVWLLKKRDQPVDQRADYRTYEQYRSGK